ncbi:hypothetical protein CC86DRAFT_366092 [Ophiobolus disseminans]|uniref:Uncharacterized protein n=1 Tax=Ophiobolus disseminans TaxID=1469910 RepID=A0A6A7AI13_9PLEO|nr:hypothetical protein CC86DRAFT_366092 [Ophiobolus disseminans]
MTQYLNELAHALDDALTTGLTTDFLMQGIEDILEDRPNAMKEVQPELAKMIADTRFKRVWAELVEARKKIQKLNEENNALSLRVKRLEMERDGMGRD